MNKIEFYITKVIVVRGMGTDKLSFETNLSSPFAPGIVVKENLSFQIQTPPGTAESFLKDNFPELKFELIDTSRTREKFRKT